MTHTLNADEKNRLELRIKEAEKRAGVQIVLAVIERSDSYAELPWKAFALGTALAGLLFFILNVLSPLSSVITASLLAGVMILSAGAVFALISVFIPDFARLFLQLHRADEETRQYGESLFLSRQLFNTKSRRAVLVMVSLFERRIVILPDMGLAEELREEAMKQIIGAMREDLKMGRLAGALNAGLQTLEKLMPGSGRSTPPDNELPDRIIEEKGA